MNTVPYVEPKPPPKTDPLVNAINRARRGTATEQIKRLLEEEARWKRKVTIATTKLGKVRLKIAHHARQLSYEADVAGVREGNVVKRYLARQRAEGKIR